MNEPAARASHGAIQTRGKTLTSIADFSSTPLAELLSLKGRVAVVTGGAQGLGKGIARRLAEAGATVLLGDRNLELARQTAAAIATEYDAVVQAIAMDVSDSAAIAGAASRAKEAFGSVDIWVNNAGVFPHIPLQHMTDADWDNVFSVNARGTFAGCREAAKAMQGRGGVIVNVASLAGLRGISPGLSAYVSSKHAVVGLTKQLALELAPERIRVIAVAPSFMVTEGNLALIKQDPRMAELAAEAIPSMMTSKLGRVGQPDDIARTVLFAVSDMASFITGETIVVDAAETA